VSLRSNLGAYELAEQRILLPDYALIVSTSQTKIHVREVARQNKEELDTKMKKVVSCNVPTGRRRSHDLGWGLLSCS
jgi:hypothetical protein